MPATTTLGRPGWAQALTSTDLMILGLDGGNPSVVLDVFELVDGVDLAGVTRCLHMLKENRAMLHCGVPRALMVYSPAAGCYAASFDGELHDDLLHLTEAQAGLWLANLSCEHGKLPDTTDHWHVVRVEGCTLSGQDTAAIEAYREHADHLDEEVPVNEDTGIAPPGKVYDRVIARAFWALAERCQDGR
ncbi:hypothetical protein ACU6VI_03380 [Sphaerotilus natans]|uniref:hypothetical protein n=1 Tax=Sphaerotilus natans TaxID=34103 RepID=UPI00406D1020